MDRVKSGVEGLDTLLCGGFLPGDAILVAGAPGTGKTSLGMQFLHYGATVAGEPGCLITFEEFPQRIYRDALNFGWDFRRLEEEGLLKVIFTSTDLMQRDFQRHDGVLPSLMREIGAKRVVVDSISHFKRLAPERTQFRETIYGVINALKREGLTAVLIRELTEDDTAAVEVEDYVSDTVIFLTHERLDDQRVRFVEVIKSRGTPSHTARSLLLIESSGLRVVPPFRPPAFTLEAAATTGLAALDALLGGGIPYGGCYLLEGSPGWPRHLLELNFLHAGLAAGERVVTLAAPAGHVNGSMALARQVGWAGAFEEASKQQRYLALSLDGRAPADLIRHLRDALHSDEPTRCLIDLNDVRRALGGEDLAEALHCLHANTPGHGAAILGAVNPHVLPAGELDGLHDLADGIIHIRQHHAYHFLQVCKTVTAAISAPLSLIEHPEPPFLYLARV